MADRNSKSPAKKGKDGQVKKFNAVQKGVYQKKMWKETAAEADLKAKHDETLANIELMRRKNESEEEMEIRL